MRFLRTFVLRRRPPATPTPRSFADRVAFKDRVRHASATALAKDGVEPTATDFVMDTVRLSEICIWSTMKLVAAARMA